MKRCSSCRESIRIEGTTWYCRVYKQNVRGTDNCDVWEQRVNDKHGVFE